MADIFISHASVDQTLAEAFARLLEGGVNLSHKQIFCTSLEDQGIPAGADFKKVIQDQLNQCEIVIALITQNYYVSAFCMCELGATWIKAKNFVPFITPPLGFGDLKGVLSGMQALRINDPAGLDQVRDRILPFSNDPAGTARWTKRKEEFLSALDALLKGLPKPKVIKPEEFQKLKEEKEDYKREYEKSDEENQKLRKKIAELKNAKDKAQVAAIERKYSSEWETFEKLTEAASSRLEHFPRVVIEALFHRFRHGDFRPDSDAWGEEPVKAEEEGLLELDEDHGTFSVNEDNPKIKKALTALRAVRQFVNEEASDEFPKQYEQKYEENFDMAIRPFWERHLMP
jgi:hypothetical protein